MAYMNRIIASIEHRSSNGDETTTYDCTLARGDVTVREFVEAVANSINSRGQKFHEWWAVVSMSLKGHDALPPCADYAIYSGESGNVVRSAELDGQPSTVNDILAKYGEYIVCSCRWNGGWGSGGYSIKIEGIEA